jgi:hypothetical protein
MTGLGASGKQKMVATYLGDPNVVGLSHGSSPGRSGARRSEVREGAPGSWPTE